MTSVEVGLIWIGGGVGRVVGGGVPREKVDTRCIL